MVMNEHWRSLSKEELERQYSPSRWSRECSADQVIPLYVERATLASEMSRSKVANRLNVPYGRKEKSKLDIYGEDAPGESPIVVYVHGGYWQELSKDTSATHVLPMHLAGIMSVVVGYELAPEASLPEIVDDICLATKFSVRLARERGSRGIVLMGWSAGAHLVNQGLISLLKSKDEDAKFVKGIISLSGVFDVRPLVHTYVNQPLQLNEDDAWHLSPQNGVQNFASHPSLQFYVVVGDQESDEFKRQSQMYCKSLQESGLKATYTEAKDSDHFNMITKLSEDENDLVSHATSFVKCVVQQ